jgi:DNA invertase Pin-like site-specific DNA recombinase
VRPDLHREKISTRKIASERLSLTAALDYLWPGDMVVVWKLDRLSRAVKEVLIIADDLRERGIGVRIRPPASASDPMTSRNWP